MGEMMAASDVKMEAPDYQEDFEDMIEVQQVQHSGPGHRVKEEAGESSRVDSVLESVIQKGLRESSKMPKADHNSDSDDWEPPEDMPPVQPKPTKKELAAEKKKQATPKAKAGRGGNKQNAAPQQMSDLLPQHFTAAGGKGSPKAKMARIPKITERVSLPTPDSLGLAGMQGPMGAMAGMAGMGQNPLIPNTINPLIPNFYGFGGMPGAGAGLIPGLSPNLLGQMAMMQQVQAAASLASRPGGEGEGDVTPDDDELEEGEISPPRTPTAVPTFPIKREKSPDVDSEKQQKNLKRKEKRRRKERKNWSKKGKGRKNEKSVKRRGRKKRKEEKLWFSSHKRETG